MPRDSTDNLQFDSDETIVVQLADKVEDGTRCYAQATDVCIGGECMVSEVFLYQGAFCRGSRHLADFRSFYKVFM